MARPHVSPARPAAQDGFGLVEVLVSALVVVVISLSVLGTLDAAGRASGTGKAKASAATLAQRDQERMQGMRAVDLMTYTDSRSVPVKTGDTEVNYTVQSEGKYVLNPGGGAGCTNGQRDEHLRIVSTVRWPGMRGARPVRIESMIAPPLDSVAPNQGSAVLKITRADGVTPVIGQSVDLVGGLSGRQTTGNEGCAFFANYPVGSYAFTFSTTGWVDPNGDEAVSLPTGVTSQDIASLDTLYDQAGAVQEVGFVTFADGVIRAAKADRLSLSHPSVQRNGGVRSSTSTGVWPAGHPYAGGSNATIEKLFPFTSPYTVYSSGQCGEALPDSIRPLVTSAGGTTQLTVTRTTRHSGLYVFEPALNPTVRYNGTGTFVARPGARVYVRSTDTACPTPDIQTTDAAGKLPERGYPYGDYQVCAQYTDGTTTYRSGWSPRTNNQPYGLDWTLDVTKAAGSVGTCA